MAEARHTKEDLKMMQALPLNLKVRLTEDRIRAWVHEFGEDGVCVAFSGGKDSTVLLHIVRNLYPNVKAVFSNTGLEYPEIQRFVRGFDNTDIIVPEMNFRDVVTKLGYPLISKEVAEAIHYARKLRGGGTELETPRIARLKRAEVQGNRLISRQAERRTDGRSYKDGCQEKKWGGVPPEVPQPGLQRSNRPRELLDAKANADGRTWPGNDTPGTTAGCRRRTELLGGGSSTDQGAAEPG